MRIKAIEYLGEHVVKLTFGDGYIGTVDLGPALSENDPLRQHKIFLQGKCNGLTIEWPGGVDFCPDVLRLWCEKGRVLPRDETDFHLGPALPIHAAA
jgi:hypothetical protein